MTAEELLRDLQWMHKQKPRARLVTAYGISVSAGLLKAGAIEHRVLLDLLQEQLEWRAESRREWIAGHMSQIEEARDAHMNRKDPPAAIADGSEGGGETAD